MNNIFEEFYFNAREAAGKKWRFQTTNYDVAGELSIALVTKCSQLIQDFVDQRIPASEYPRRLKEHFGLE